VKELKLLEDTKAKLTELRALSDRAAEGDKGARKKLREALQASSPEIVARYSDFGRRGQLILAETMAAGEPLIEEALSARLDLMRAEVAGENPTALEALLVERVASCWLLTELFEVLTSAQLARDNEHRVPMSYLKHMIKWQESAHNRLLSSIRELARIRKLQSSSSGIQVNTQINLGTEC